MCLAGVPGCSRYVVEAEDLGEMSGLYPGSAGGTRGVP